MKVKSALYFVLATISSIKHAESFKWSRHLLKQSFRISATPTKTPQTPQKISKKDKADIWRNFSKTANEQVKRYFVYCATMVGIPWKAYYDLGAENMNVLLANYLKINEPSIVYPEYYTQPIHSYAEGNLNWEASLEVVAATMSISASYWPLADVASAESWMRGNTTSAIQKHIHRYESTLSSKPKNTGRIMDIGCSVGLSTKFLIEAFPEKNAIAAVDLSPYFLSAAMFYHRKKASPLFTTQNDKIEYYHMMAEDMKFPSNSYDIVSISFLLHEIPTKIAEKVLAEAFRVLRPGGTLSIVDLSINRIKTLPQVQVAFFELTEPHIRQYYKTDPMKILADTGFTFIETKKNDPMNALWVASKPFFPPYSTTKYLYGTLLPPGPYRLNLFIRNMQASLATRFRKRYA